MKILAIGAHPDDIELFMYGLLSACKLRGDQIYMGIATDGSAGGNKKGVPLVTIREKETIEALKLIGTPTFFRAKDGFLSKDKGFLDLIRKYILDLSPDLIITHDQNDYHPDHRALSSHIQEIAGFSYPILYCETLMGNNFEPDYYIDITKHFYNKKEAIFCHKSQNPNRLFEMVEVMNKYRALQCNALTNQYAETFKIKKQFPFVEMRDFLPASMKIRGFNLTNQN